MGPKAFPFGDSDHKVARSSMGSSRACRTIAFDQAALARALLAASLSLHRKPRRGRGGGRRVETLVAKSGRVASCGRRCPPGDAEVCGMKAAHRRELKAANGTA